MSKVGDKFNYRFKFTQVNKFAEISGDNNPIHTDADYAAKTIFKKPIIHGIFSSSIFSKYFGTIWPGEGAIYLSQTLQFKRPMYVDTEYEMQAEIKEINSAKNTALVACRVIDLTTGKETISGEATMMHKEKIK
jgi:acyl dehydratase